MPRVGPFLLGIQTDRGQVREENEDAYGFPDVLPEPLATRGYLFAVADGVGGYGNGQEASALVITTLYEQYYGPEPIELLRAIQLSNMAVRRLALEVSERDRRMSSTLVALLFRDTTFQVAYVGDSRAYLVRQGAIQQLTSDHSLVQEQVTAGLIDATAVLGHQHKHVITRAVGGNSTVEVDLSTSDDLRPGDRFVICSDGLTNHVDDLMIADLVSRYAPDQAAPLLVQLANQAGGLDNITVAVIGYEPDARGAAALGPGMRPGGHIERMVQWLLIALGVGGIVGIAILLALPFFTSG